TIREKLADIPPGPDLILEGDGDVWHFEDTPKHGHRTFSYEPSTDFFTDESYDAYPLSYDIDQIGAAKKKIAITFDDGPDPRWTPRILDILKQENVPATFFVIGKNGQAYPDLVRRMVAEGHEVGNHTFPHPNLGEIPGPLTDLELNAT